jgi:glutamate formiminotransferase
VQLECVVNVSEGRDADLIATIAAGAGDTLLDLQSDADHHRSVLTLGGDAPDVEEAARSVVTEAVRRLDLTGHVGVHPRLGVADVVPFVPLDGAGPDDALAARNRFAGWEGGELHVPCFLYGPERPLPEVRREAFRTLDPDTGPPTPHPTAGATAVGARPLLVAYNVWITVTDGGVDDPEGALAMAREIAETIRTPTVRSLGLPVGTGAQVSCNLLDAGPGGVAELFDAVARLVETSGGTVGGGELVGLVPAAVLAGTPTSRWAELDLSEDRTIESRLEARGTPVATGGRG